VPNTEIEHTDTFTYDANGKIIGRQGMTINAIRSLLLAGSAKKGLRCTLEIVEEARAA